MHLSTHFYVFLIIIIHFIICSIFILCIFRIIYYFLIIHSTPSFPSPILINRQDTIHSETANSHEYCVMRYMLSFCHQARCLSVSEFERLADHKRMYHIADAMVFAGLYGWRPVFLLVWLKKGDRYGDVKEKTEKN